jgi:CysZ protein
MQLLQGMAYNLRGLKFSLKTPKLLMLGLLRFVALVIVTVAATAIILTNYQEILSLMWHQPQSTWVVWLWHLVSWLLALLLMGISAILGFIVAQVLFNAVIMDMMSKVTERKLTGSVASDSKLGWVAYFFFILRQEVPRTILPVLVSLLIMVLGWFTPLGPLLTILSSLAAVIFLAWDNTDLLPARRMTTYGKRFKFLRSHLMFHIGFGVLFLVPVVNILLLSFAPVGATMYHIDQAETSRPS